MNLIIQKIGLPEEESGQAISKNHNFTLCAIQTYN
jgi:hypothetical protein